MQILSVTLRNFKSHADRHITFEPGTNAICGENGAGKTSVLEAIAWTLFNHRGSYRTEDLIRNGNGSAQARVAFISSRDGRTYEVERCTTKGYTLFDPQLGERLEYHHIEQEVLPWLRQHLGVAPGTDLARLFANTIGVPQGTFTADFLKTAEDRRRVFDSILKVEEYKKVTQEMLSLEKYAKAQVEELERAIARYDEALQALEPTQQRVVELREQVAAGEAQLQQWQMELVGLQQRRDALKAEASQIQALQTQQQQVAGQREAKQQAIALLTQAVQDTQAKIQQWEASRPAFEAYQDLLKTIQQGEVQLQQRQPLQRQRETVQKQVTAHTAQVAAVATQLAQVSGYQAELETLHPLVAQQTQWEQRQGEVAIALQQTHNAKLEAAGLEQQAAKLTTQHTQLQQEVARLTALAETVAQIPWLEQQRDRLQAQLSRIEAAQQFEAELRQLVQTGVDQRDRHHTQVETARALLAEIQTAAPLLAADAVAAVLVAVEAGAALTTELLAALQGILADLTQQTDAPRLKADQKQVTAQLKAAHQAEAAYATLPQKSADLAQQLADLTQLQDRRQALEPLLHKEASHLQQQQEIKEALAELNNPKGRVQLLETEVAKQPALEQQHAAALAKADELAKTLAELEAQLQQFAQLEAQINQFRGQLQQHQEGYLTHRQHAGAIAQLPQQEADLLAATTLLTTLDTQYQAGQTALAERLATFDPEALPAADAAYTQTQRQADQLSGALPPKRTLLAELNSQVQKLETVAATRRQAQQDLKTRQKTLKFVRFARKAYKEAGPRITERYLQSISREADRLFRELLNRPNVALEWTRDYEICVQETQHTRRFVNLSGGEQMCAALAVRLALLRVLADIDVAFFDEPTTNMDRQRRQSLAEAIANIKSFKQIFVISHDDTFEQVTENVITLSREG